MVRCPSEPDLLNWKQCLSTQIKCSPQTNYIRPCLSSPRAPDAVVVIDLGSTSVRAGILGTSRKCDLKYNREIQCF